MARCVFAYHGLLVVMSAIPGEWAFIVARSIELEPPFVAEAFHARKVTPEASRLLPVGIRKLALVASNRYAVAFWE